MALGREAHPVFLLRAWRHRLVPAPRPPGTPEGAPEMHPFMGSTPPTVLAGWYLRSEYSEGWVLPSDIRRPWDWVAAAIQHWALTYRQFPLVGGWWNQSAWQTKAEADSSQRTADLKARLIAITTQLEGEIATAQAQVEEAARDASGGRRRLLTHKGDPLKQAVAEALEALGYTVTDRDKEEPLDPGGKVEDLGVADRDDSTTDPLTEVKGYDNGAKASDLADIGRHLTRAVRIGRSPTAIWWVINHWRKRPPDDRGPVLAGEEAMIARHASDQSPLVLIDTRDLFRVLRAVEEGQVSAETVRESLRAARGRWAPPL